MVIEWERNGTDAIEYVLYVHLYKFSVKGRFAAAIEYISNSACFAAKVYLIVLRSPKARRIAALQNYISPKCIFLNYL